MNSIKLNNGIEMPQIGMGTFLIPQEEISRTIGRAYELGYRQFDTAWRLSAAYNYDCLKMTKLYRKLQDAGLLKC